MVDGVSKQPLHSGLLKRAYPNNLFLPFYPFPSSFEDGYEIFKKRRGKGEWRGGVEG